MARGRAGTPGRGRSGQEAAEAGARCSKPPAATETRDFSLKGGTAGKGLAQEQPWLPALKPGWMLALCQALGCHCLCCPKAPVSSPSPEEEAKVRKQSDRLVACPGRWAAVVGRQTWNQESQAHRTWSTKVPVRSPLLWCPSGPGQGGCQAA